MKLQCSNNGTTTVIQLCEVNNESALESGRRKQLQAITRDH